GRWAATFAENSLSDEMIYEQDGTYIRYMAPRTILTITFSEQSFFLQNNQKPVVRIAELAFHTLLFCTLIIELFALTFLVLKLISKPFIHLIGCRWRRSNNQSFEFPTTLSKKNVHKENSSGMINHRLRSFELRRKLRTLRRQKRKQKTDKITHETVREPSNFAIESSTF
ncbi:unnamed protein product, partial [Rotaria sordida]